MRRYTASLSLLVVFLVALSGAALAKGGPSGGGGGGGGGGGTKPAPTPTPTGAVTVASVAVSPLKVAYDSTATGTVRLSRVPDAPFTVNLHNDSFNSPVVAMNQDSVTITPPASSATFPVTGGNDPFMRTHSVQLEAFTADSGATTQFYVVPFANTDLIRITSASISKNGDLKVAATTDTPSAILTATFAGTNVPLRNNGGGRWSGQAKVPVTSDDVTVRSNLGGCFARSPFQASGGHLC
jgi:hypothetical protein